MRTQILAAIAAVSIPLLAQTEDQVRRSVPMPDSGNLVLAAEVGSINVEPGVTRFAQIEVSFRGHASRAEFNRMLQDFTLDVTQQGSEVRVNGRFKQGWKPGKFGGWFSHGMCRDGKCLEYRWLRQIEYRVTVPKQASVDLSTSGGSISVSDLGGQAAARTSGGALSFGHIEGPVDGRTSGGSIRLISSRGKALLRTSGGGIEIQNAEGDLDAETSGGSIRIDRAKARVRAHTSGGSITIRDAAGTLDASTSGGSVTALLSAQPAEACRLSTSGGGISVQLAGNLHMEVDASTSGGSVSTDFPVAGRVDGHHSLHTAINGGGPLLYLRTSGGGIQIRKGT